MRFRRERGRRVSSNCSGTESRRKRSQAPPSVALPLVVGLKRLIDKKDDTFSSLGPFNV